MTNQKTTRADVMKALEEYKEAVRLEEQYKREKAEGKLTPERQMEYLKIILEKW